MKKIIGSILVIVIIASMMVGCGNKAEIPEGEPIIMENPTEPKFIIGTVIVHSLNVRNEPSAYSDVLRQLSIDTDVEIFEQVTLDGILWGRIDYGWINLAYVDINSEDYMICESCGAYNSKEY